MTHPHFIDPDDLARGVNDRLITIREAGDGQRIYNYSDAAIYTPGAWENPAVRQCRGLIVSADGRVVARPWAKFFNHGQAEAGALDMDAPVEVTDKLDGSLGIIHVSESGEIRVATRGSFESDQAIHATAWLAARGWYLMDLNQYTPLVEIIYPGNRIVCDYGDRDELVLLGGVITASGVYVGPREMASLVNWPGAVAGVFEYPDLRSALAAPPRPGAEGLCVRFLGESRIVKIKQEDYVRLHRIVTGLSERTVWEHMSSGKGRLSILNGIPDELHAWVNEVWDRLAGQQLRIYNRAEAAHRRVMAAMPDGWTRKDYAEAASRHVDVRPYLFNILDGRDPRPSILRTLKPEGDTRAKAISEAVA